jgi:hypothetical protein
VVDGPLGLRALTLQVVTLTITDSCPAKLWGRYEFSRVKVSCQEPVPEPVTLGLGDGVRVIQTFAA